MNRLRIAAEAFLPAKYTAEYWKAREIEARKFMEERRQSPIADTYLIAVASQHPSVSQQFPHEEYRLRLDEAMRLVEEIESEKAGKKGRAEIAVFDSRHQDDISGGPDDLASLADIGKAYLISRGFPQKKIHSVWTDLHKGAMGGYNGADEALAASHAFIEHDYYRKIYFVLSPDQQTRARLNFLANGVLPHFRIPRDISKIKEPYHSSELVSSALIRITKRRDPDWQGPGSLMSQVTREARVPTGGSSSLLPFDELLVEHRQRFATGQDGQRGEGS